METTQEIERNIDAASKGKNGISSTTLQELPVPAGQFRTDEGVHAANILVTTRRDGLVRAKKEFEEILRLTREKLKVLDDVEESRRAGNLEEENESRNP